MPPTHAPALAALALTFNALTWGLAWWPLRQLESAGLHPLWATALIYAAASLLIATLRPRALLEVLGTPALWVLVLAAGATNAAFNWAVTVGDVVRVVLLFYLMPLWAVLLARAILGERIDARALSRVGIALAGAVIVLRPQGGGWPLPGSLADALGILGGFTFALNNVMLRREGARSRSARAFAMFFGGAIVAALVVTPLTTASQVPAPPALAAGWLITALLLCAAFIGSNLALQFGVSRLPAHATAVIMLTEVLFAAVSAAWLGAGALTPRVLAGGGMILLAAGLAAADRRAFAAPAGAAGA